MCKDTFGKQAINWRSVTPRPRKMRRWVIFQHFSVNNGKDWRFSFFFFFFLSFLFCPFGRGRHTRWQRDARREPRRSCHRVRRAWRPSSATAVCVWWTQEARDDRVHELINECAATACQKSDTDREASSKVENIQSPQMNQFNARN